jgi:hypothetical protein
MESAAQDNRSEQTARKAMALDKVHKRSGDVRGMRIECESASACDRTQSGSVCACLHLSVVAEQRRRLGINRARALKFFV